MDKLTQIQTAAETVKANTAQIEDSFLKAKAFGLQFAQIEAIETDEEDERILIAYKKVKATAAKIEGLRKAFTVPLDNIKKEYIAKEKELFGICDTMKALRDDRANRKHQAAEAERQRIEAEKARKIAEAEAEAKLKSELENLPQTLLNQTENFLIDVLSSNDLQNLQQIKQKLNFKPAIKEAAYLKVFEKYQIPTDDIQAEFPLELISKKYEALATETLNTYKAKIESRIVELKNLEALNEAEKEKAEKAMAERAKAEKEAQAAKVEAQRKEAEEKAKAEAEEKAINAEIEAQIETQMADDGKTKGSTTKWSAEVKKMTSYQHLIAYYIAQGGDLTKLEFLANFAAKNGRPEIDGVKYVSTISTSARWKLD